MYASLKQPYVSASRTVARAHALCTESAGAAILAQRLREKAVSAARIRDLFAKLRIWFREDAARIIVHVSAAPTFTASYVYLYGGTCPTHVRCVFLFHAARLRSGRRRATDAI